MAAKQNQPDWIYDPFDEGSAHEAGEYTIKQFQKVLEENHLKTQEIVTALETNSADIWSDIAPVCVKYDAHEKMSFSQVIDTDNKNFNKVLRTLAYISCELNFFCHEANTKFIPALLVYGEGAPKADEAAASSVPLQLGRMLPLLQELLSFTHRCNEIVKHTVQQLACLYDPARKSQGLVDVIGAHFLVIFEGLADVLTVLVTLDNILSRRNSLLLNEWELYKRMVTSMKHDPERFGYKPEQLKPFEKVLMTLQGELLEGKILLGCFEQVFDDRFVQPSRSSSFNEEFITCLRLILNRVETRLETTDSSVLETDERYKYVGLCCLLVLHYHVFRAADRRLFRALWDLHKKLPAVVLYGRVVVYPCSLLMTNLKQLVPTLDKKAVQLAESSRVSWLQTHSSTLQRDVDMLGTRTAAWSVRMDAPGWRQNPTKSDMLLEGLSLANRARHLATALLALHTEMGKPMRSGQLLCIGKLLERLKDIELTYFRRSSEVTAALPEIIQGNTVQALKILGIARDNLKSRADKRYSDKRLDVLSGVLLAESSLTGPSSPTRRLVARLAAALANQLKVLSTSELEDLRVLFRRLALFAELEQQVAVATDCSFFLHYFRGGPLELCLKELRPGVNGTNGDVNRLRFILLAMRDCARPLQALRHRADPEVVVSELESEVIALVERCVLQPLCQEIEKDLRLQTHTHLRLDERNPLRAVAGDSVEDLCHFIRVRPLKVIQKWVNIRSYVEHYLDATFYNLTTVALHDWKVYGEMKKLAQHKYRLYLTEPHLPSQTLEQGLDVLVIMRKINVFVENHNYNLNNQIFVEKSSKNKHLNTINIRHMANSIRTHGIGIMNTTVNFTYQYVKNVLGQLYGFLCHESVKARLLKETNYFRENHSGTDQTYPFERAESLNRNMRALGQHPKLQLTFWDLFRQTITHIGNAMGYVRLVRSGGLQCCSKAIRFVPDLEDIPNFEEIASQSGGASPETLAAAKQLDSCVEHLHKAASGGADYLHMLGELKQLRSHKQDLRSFPVAVPALTVNFVEHISAAKERLNKKNKEGAGFTDDGFAMGIAYLLKVLDMYKEFDALHWQEAVKERMNRERTRVRTQLESKLDEKHRQTLTLALRRLDTQEREYEMLRFSLRSARIFFRADLPAVAPRTPETVSATSADAAAAGDTAAAPQTN